MGGNNTKVWISVLLNVQINTIIGNGKNKYFSETGSIHPVISTHILGVYMLLPDTVQRDTDKLEEASKIIVNSVKCLSNAKWRMIFRNGWKSWKLAYTLTWRSYH